MQLAEINKKLGNTPGSLPQLEHNMRDLKIPKIQQRVTLWVHPEGRVIGNLYLAQTEDQNEQPADVVNQDKAFLVINREDPNELRFYNRNTIIRVEYEDSQEASTEETHGIPCQLHMMDGSLINGEICEKMPPDFPRLFDYLNQQECRFVKMYVDNDMIYLVNKSYINYASAL